MVSSMKRVLAIASAGGHFQQLMVLSAAFDKQDVTYVTTLPGLADEYGAAPSLVVRDANRNTPVAALLCVLQILAVIFRKRPDIVVTTGAMPGLIAVAAGRVVGAHTIWVDSVANAEELSASGRYARRIAHSCFSQWPEVARAEGVVYAGSIL